MERHLSQFPINTTKGCILNYVVLFVEYLRQTAFRLDSNMLEDSPTTDPEPDPDEDLDDPYVHLVSTEEFVETAEKGSQEHEE